jgi:hypothetical protein
VKEHLRNSDLVCGHVWLKACHVTTLVEHYQRVQQTIRALTAATTAAAALTAATTFAAAAATLAASAVAASAVAASAVACRR